LEHHEGGSVGSHAGRFLPCCEQVSAETQRLYDDTLEEAQGVPNLLNDVGKDIGNFICQ
jgi:hypothetical protein